MSNVGAENPFPPNGYREPSYRGSGSSTPTEGTSVSYGDYGTTGTQPTASQKSEEPTGEPEKVESKDQGKEQGEGINLDKVLAFAKNLTTKAQGVPYLLPVAAGAAGFVLGVLASSRILRQVVLMAGSYAVKEAVKAAPKDEIFAYAKRFLIDRIEKQRV